MVYLIVGVDRSTLSPWHANVRGRNVAVAREAAQARASAAGVDLVVAAVLEPSSSVPVA
jgi:hypothetical protein